MICSRLRFKALGACALAFSMMAAWAGTAQAEETGGKWTYLTKASELKTFEGALAEPEIGGKIETGTVLVLHSEALGGTKILYECKALAAVGAKLKSNGVALGKLRFTECDTFLNGVLSLPCVPLSQTIETNLIEAQMLLHKLAGGTVDKILIAQPETAEGQLNTTFALIHSSASCALGLNVPVGGKFAIELSNPTTHEVEHLVKEFSPLTHLWIISDTAEHKANILGSGLAFLAGAHAGLKWAGLWN
jgi:hypothetical protein